MLTERELVLCLFVLVGVAWVIWALSQITKESDK